MKNLLIIFVMAFLLFSCATPDGEKTIEKIITEKDNSINSGYKLLNQKVYPQTASVFKFSLPSFGSKLYAGNGNTWIDVDATTKHNNFVAGIFYHDNSINSTDPIYNNIWRTLDFSANLSAGHHRVTVYIKIIADGTDLPAEQAIFRFRTPNSTFPPKEISQSLSSEYTTPVELTTDENGCIEWCYAGGNPYDEITELADPGVHNYKRIKAEIWLYESWKSDVL